MKILLALSLLLFLDSVFSQRDLIDCAASGTCPKRFRVDDSPCSDAIFDCVNFKDRNCVGMESKCPPEEIINTCDEFALIYYQVCDRANQKITKNKYAKTQQRCVNLKNDCLKFGGYLCPRSADFCDPDTTIQMCAETIIYSHEICQRAELQKEKDRAAATKYSCKAAESRCRATEHGVDCNLIPKYCDVDTAAKWCYKNETENVYTNDVDCLRVVKKSQYLMFEKSKPECWKYLPLCEKGDSEACTQVPAFCEKEIVSALCNAKKIKSDRICKYAGWDKTSTPSHPGCGYLADKCIYDEGEYCSFVVRYCANHVVDFLCGQYKITNKAICKSAKDGDPNALAIPRPIVGTVKVPGVPITGSVKLPGGFGLGF